MRFGRAVRFGAGAVGLGGRAAYAASRTTVGRRGGKGVLYGGAAVAGTMSSLLDQNNKWADVQETAFGERDTLRATIKSSVSGGGMDPLAGTKPASHYYGRPYNASALRRRNTPYVDGSIVFGAYNMRRDGY